jgi:hypothetical protein
MDTSRDDTLPSNLSALLRSLVGLRLVEATRFSWWPPDEAQKECSLASEDVFSLTAGPVTLTFDSGVVVGIASNPSTNSVSVWLERDKEEPLSTDEELYPVSATDSKFASTFWHQVIGARVDAVSIFVQEPRTVSYQHLPNEVGLCLTLDSGARVVAAHGLHDDSDDFSIIPEQLVMEELRAGLEEVRIEEEGVSMRRMKYGQ